MSIHNSKTNERTLLSHHQELISRSGITPEVATARGYRSVTQKAELRRLGFGDAQCRVPALLVPVWSVTGEIGTYQIRPDEPRIKDGKPLKYETPAKTHMVLDVPPATRRWISDPSRPLFITEGARKADSAVSRGLCCVALLGVWNWRGSNEFGGKTALPDWEAIALNDRAVYLCFDSDVTVKPAVHQAMARLKAFLEQREARVHVVYLPAGPGGEKVGLDDYLAAGHSLEELLALACGELRCPPHAGTEEPPVGPYRETEGGLVWLKQTQNGEIPTPLTNFIAKIVAQVIEDDGVETSRLLELEARLDNRLARFGVLAPQFSAMNWPIERLGSDAVVYAGFGLREHARTAIQLLSGATPTRRVFTHTGWREIGGNWCYLHAGGGIGANGPADGVEVRLPDALSRFRLPDPPTGDRLVEAIRASLGILGLAPEQVTIPLLCAVYRAAMSPSDLSLHYSGPTGSGKTALATLAQQHWGSEHDARNLAGSWSSTGNALEALAFAAKDALLVIDDFAPTGAQSDIARMHREADRLLRAQGNRSGRMRLRADSSLRPARPPRGLIVSTGEDVPRGESLRARVLVLELSAEMLKWEHLTRCQAEAASGLYAEALAGFVAWLAPRYDVIQTTLREEIRMLRIAASQSGQHRRTPEIVANLAVGLRYLLHYAQEAGAITSKDAAGLWQRGWQALGEAAGMQATHQAAAEPTRRFLELVRAAISSGRAYVAGRAGDEPDSPRRWGWRLGSGDNADEWRPQGDLIGWADGDDLYLEPNASYAAAQDLARHMGDAIAVSSRTLHKRLHDKGFLASTEPARKTLTVRHMLAGARRQVLHLHASRVMPPGTDQPDQTDPSGFQDDLEACSGQLPGQFLAPPPLQTDQANCPGGGSKGPDGSSLVMSGSLVSSTEDEIQTRADNECGAGDTPDAPCYSCGGARFWRSRDGLVVCATCHPPPAVSLVAAWIEVPGDERRSEALEGLVAQDR